MGATVSIQRAKHYIDTLFYKAAEPFLANNQLCGEILEWFGDDASRKLYKDEITFKIVAQLLGNDSAVNLCPAGLTRTQWDTAYLETLHSKESWPELSFPENEPWPFCTYTMTYKLEQYRYQDIVDVVDGDVFIDCGSFVLDAAIWALHKGAKSIVAFEPNPDALPHMHINKAHHDPEDKIQIINAGVADKTGYCAFDGSQGGASSMNSTGEQQVPVVSLDDFFEGSGIVPTYIKMDIEGFEQQALAGAQHSIRTHTPKLAICVYHKLEDLWSIPAYIKSLVPEYTFYLKKHGKDCDLVLYATV